MSINLPHTSRKGQTEQGDSDRVYPEVGQASPQVTSISEECQILVAEGDSHVNNVPRKRTQTRGNLGKWTRGRADREVEGVRQLAREATSHNPSTRTLHLGGHFRNIKKEDTSG